MYNAKTRGCYRTISYVDGQWIIDIVIETNTIVTEMVVGA